MELPFEILQGINKNYFSWYVRLSRGKRKRGNSANNLRYYKNMRHTTPKQSSLASQSVLLTVAACSHAVASTPSPSFSPSSAVPMGFQNSGSSTQAQAAASDEALRVAIPRGGSSSFADTSSSTTSAPKAKDGGENKKWANKKKRNSGTSSSANNTNKQRSSKAAPSASESSGKSQQQQESKSALSPEAQSILSQTCHYDVLGITTDKSSATFSEIQKAYRRRAMVTHPDKTNGDRTAFDKVSAAYDVLSCDKKRAVYDRFGMDGLLNDQKNGDGSGFFGGVATDVFREFFGGGGSGMGGASTFFGTQFNHPGGGASTRSSSSFGPRNRDLRYQLEVSLEDLYNGSSKHVAIQQPNPFHPHLPYRKEVEVSLTKGMHSGQSVRLSGVVDSIPDAAPADVIFLINERRHPIFTRRGNDLAMELHITLSEAIVGYKKKIVGLDGREIVICNPYEGIHVLKEELVDAPSLPDIVGADHVDEANNNTVVNSTSFYDDDDATTMKEFPVQQIVKTTTLSYNLPSTIIQTGDVHVLKGGGMPIHRKVGRYNHHNHDYGDLFVQFIVDLPGGSTSSPSSLFSAAGVVTTSKSKLNTKNLSPEERVELARLLSKLEGKEDPTTDVVKVLNGKDDASNNDIVGENKNKGKESIVHRLVVSSASEFGRKGNENDADHDEHLHHQEDDEIEEYHNRRGHVHDFFQRAFHHGERSSHSGFTGPFGFGFGGTSFGGGSVRYFSSSSSSSSGRRGGPVYGEEDDHQVECSQM